MQTEIVRKECFGWCLIALFAFLLVLETRGSEGPKNSQASKNRMSDSAAAFNTFRGQNQALNLIANLDGAVERSGKRKLNIGIQIALVFFRKEATGQLFSKKADGQRDDAKEDEAENGFVHQQAA